MKNYLLKTLNFLRAKTGKRERGQILVLVVIFLLLGVVILAPTLAYTNTTLKVTQQNIERNEQFYAADAGFKDAIHKLKYDFNNTIANLTTDGATWTYTNVNPINDELMSVTIIRIQNQSAEKVFHIGATAGSSGTNTTVEAYVTALPVFFVNAAIAKGTIDMGGNKGTIDGDVYADTDPGYITEGNEYKGPYNGIWPTITQLRTYYASSEKANATPQQPSGSISSITAPGTIGPKYINGNLEITGTGEITLTGTLYINGNLTFANTDWGINLNGNTIYITGSAVQAKKKGYIKGPGAIIAEGDIGLWPNGDVGSPTDFVFLMSVTGQVQLKSESYVYGSIAGAASVSIDMQNSHLTLTDYPSGGIDFPLYDSLGNPTVSSEWSTSNWQSYLGIMELTITNGSPLPIGNVSTAYSQQLYANGGASPYTWLVTAGSLPSGLTLTGDTISGTPTTSGISTFTVQVTDNTGKTTEKEFELTINDGVASISVSPASALIELSGTQQLTAQAYSTLGDPVSATFTWTVSGGGTIDSNGLFTAGTTAGGPYNVQAALGIVTGTATVTILEMDTTTLVSSSNSESVYGDTVTFTATVLADAGTPTGTVTFSNQNGTFGSATLVNGIATIDTGAAWAAGNYTITAKYNDDSNYNTSSGSLTQIVHLKITPASFSDQKNKSLSPTVTMTAQGGSGNNTWSMTGLFTDVAQTIPYTVHSLGINPATGVISGTMPKSAGTYYATVTVVDNVTGVTTSLQITIIAN